MLDYGVSFARAVTDHAELVGEVNGRVSTRSGEPFPGTESRGALTVGGRYTRGAYRLDAGFFWGLTPTSPTVGFTAGDDRRVQGLRRSMRKRQSNPRVPVLSSRVPVRSGGCRGQSGQAARDAAPADPPPAIGSTLTAETLADLPLGDNIYAALETTQPEVIADRFNSGGLNAGEAARVGGFLESSTRTVFRIGEIDVSDPAGSGSPLMFPELLFWRRVDVATGLMPADLNTLGLATTLEPRLPTGRWTTTLQGSGSGGSLAGSTPSGPVPPIARLDGWAHGSALVTGPMTNRTGIVAGGTWTQASEIVRGSSPTSDSDLASAFVNLVYTPAPATEWRTLGWAQQSTVPFTYRRLFQPAASVQDDPGGSTRDTSGHVQSTWERRTPGRLAWRVLGGVTERSRASDTGTISSVTADRLTDGPIPSIIAATGDATARRWTLAGRVVPAARSPRHATELGLNVDRASVTTSDQFSGSVRELVDGTPARVWAFTHPAMDSHRHATTIAAFASDRTTFSPSLILDTALRFESISGAAEGAATGVTWHTWLPSAFLRWEFAEGARVSLVAGYRRSANQLNLDLLTVGDPAAPTAIVSVASPVAPVVDLVGPGTGGDPAFSRIDEELKRPTTDEYTIGIESRRQGWPRLSLTGIARREANMIALVDTGVPVTSYSTIGIPDVGLDVDSGVNTQVLTVYNRTPSTFGRNQYLLTNPDQQAATAYALKLTVEGSTDRLFLLLGATASMATGSAGNRGYGPLENDQDAVGEQFTNPNAATFARGRLFTDRAFTIKWTTVYRFPWDIRVGAIARYQDGQPFARLVVVPGLNQGAEAVRAYENGLTRFTFTGSLDLRLQKGFAVGKSRIDGIVDLYNLATRSNEVEEYVVTGPDFRAPTAIEPPRSIHLGVRLTF